MTDICPKIVILTTGGTIVSSGASATQMTGYSIADYQLGSLIDAVPSLAQTAQLDVRSVCNIDSSSMTAALWMQLRAAVSTALADPEVTGVVITHGTDTMEETAYFLHLTVATHKPIVLTGAMRPATALSADGPLNLLNAVRVACCPAAVGKGVLIVLNDTIGSARDTTKTHPTNVATFASSISGSLGLIAGERIEFFNSPTRLHTAQSQFTGALPTLPRVDIVTSHVDDDAVMVQAALAAGARGIVHAGTGNGSIHSATEQALLQAAQHGVLVVRASRTSSGMVVDGLSRWQQAGFISAGTLNAPKARILLQLALTEPCDAAAAARLFERY